MLYRKEAVYAVYAVGQVEIMQQYKDKIEFGDERGDAVTCGHMRSPHEESDCEKRKGVL